MKSLQQEFQSLDVDIVATVYTSLNQDYEQTRNTLREMMGQQSVDLTTGEIGPTEFVLEEVQGDVFSCALAASLCHCVSQDLAMGKGIAVQFKQRYGQVSELKAQHAGIGEAAVIWKPN